MRAKTFRIIFNFSIFFYYKIPNRFGHNVIFRIYRKQINEYDDTITKNHNAV